MTTKADARVITLGNGLDNSGSGLIAKLGGGMAFDGNGAVSGDFQLLKNILVSTPVSAIDLTGYDPNSEFDDLHLSLVGMRTASGAVVGFQFSNNGGASYQSGASDYRQMQIFVNDAGSSNGATSTAAYGSLSTTTLASGVAYYQNQSVEVNIPVNRFATDNQKWMCETIAANSTPNQVGGFNHGTTTLAFAGLNAIRIMNSASVNFTAGRVMLFGRRKR